MLAQNITRPREQLRVLRAQMADAVEKLISAMDHIDGDPDLELEPDLEITCEDEGAQCDDEGHDGDTELNGDEGVYVNFQDATWLSALLQPLMPTAA
ncbi:hypothetical protein ABENE_23625 [Asticcacaulis benevestitus DSM 16100 = ATCC BAA-896]|uniref:Uncharacterized protein n=1 Tax=Asticcacaulis benevestitus DSM 16100 = ATCC BAA-896 TaxID=1121022 RepID=V4Q6T4_9CAUL|nr:hypothetical protein [Asticcacaulis benevestitus]ESQ74953.1 hypothetical protein ABENE_23625 [Asticcacaulis benevestitus DSM 16100 = ATCC BAA-896]